MTTPIGKMCVYGCNISYYTGKFETYLRYRSVPYDSAPTVGNYKKLKEGAGVVQMPVVQNADGSWMTDTTPMIRWMESQQEAPSIYPSDPAMNVLALLIEDYADEWLWRSAMHYRWSYRPDRQYAAESLYNSLMRGTMPFPRFIALNMLKRRQFFGYVRGDGVNKTTRFHADRTYLTALDRLQVIFENRPFILGNAPTIADFGIMAPMYRHFGQDPTPVEIMRNRAPAVYEWVARMWNTKAAGTHPELISEPDKLLADFLEEISETHLAQLRQNAVAYDSGQKRYDQVIQDCHYTQLPVSRYRVWCLEELQREFSALDDADQTRVKGWLLYPEAEILWSGSVAKSNYDPDRKAPFNRGINVFDGAVPMK
ncbi:MAG: glutathione S-transferase N-terminal domain-containing protein [Pseudomonadota bacterium]